MALARWKGSDGEDVRRFAFERELARLSESQARTLFALCVLGDTSFIELQQITESTRRLLQDDIAELRKYHLLAVGSDIPMAGVRLIVASGVRLMKDLLKSRVYDPKRIEVACSKTRAGTPTLGEDIGRVVHEVVALWRAGSCNDALDLARWAGRTYPKNADIKCLLGRAYLQIAPPSSHDADVILKEAYDLGCTRPELWKLWMEARRLREDWRGLIEITRMADEQHPNAENDYARALAYESLAESVRSGGDLRRAADYYLEGGRDIDELFKRNMAKGRIPELQEYRSTFMQNYVWLIDSLNQDPQDQIHTWLAVVEAFNRYTRTELLVRFGIERLSSWWTAVEDRVNCHMKSADLMSVQLSALARMRDALRTYQTPNDELLQHVSMRSSDLAGRLERYVSQLDNATIA
jgi:hypothetical protein